MENFIFCASIVDVWQGLKWVKVFRNEPSKIYGRQLLKNSKWYGLPKETISF